MPGLDLGGPGGAVRMVGRSVEVRGRVEDRMRMLFANGLEGLEVDLRRRAWVLIRLV